MSSTILYRFRSGTTFESLPLPGSAARLFDVKKAIVHSKKLDQAGALEFDLSVKDATTDEEYMDENALLPRGTRLVIQRLPAAKGQGLLSRMARNPYGGLGPGAAMQALPGTVQPGANFYTIDTRTHPAEEDEFVSTSAASSAVKQESQEDQELAALRAATDAASQAARSAGMATAHRAPGFRSGQHVAGQGPPPPPPRGGPPQAGGGGGTFVPRARPNADPELRDQEKQLMPKKRATGIPRTFLNLNAPPQTDGGGSADGGDNANANVPLLQPNAIGFEELVNRGGGQSEMGGGTKRDLEYALKLTATTVPEYLQCAICHNVVRDAMILPWDPEGRTTCESCIRDALTQNGFRCPLTGQEGVSPDDLLPNHALRKAAEQFVKGVMEKMEEIEKQQVDDDFDDTATANEATTGSSGNILDGEGADKGIIISKRTSIADRKKKQDEDDPFGSGGDDVFGGDVFAVPAEEKTEEEDDNLPVKTETSANDSPNKEAKGGGGSTPQQKRQPSEEKNSSSVKMESSKQSGSDEENCERGKGGGGRHSGGSPSGSRGRSRSPSITMTPNNKDHYNPKSPDASSSRRDASRRRGIPMGYHMGPAMTARGPREPEPSPRDHSGNNNRHGGSSFDAEDDRRDSCGRSREDRGKSREERGRNSEDRGKSREERGRNSEDKHEKDDRDRDRDRGDEDGNGGGRRDRDRSSRDRERDRDHGRSRRDEEYSRGHYHRRDSGASSGYSRRDERGRSPRTDGGERGGEPRSPRGGPDDDDSRGTKRQRSDSDGESHSHNRGPAPRHSEDRYGRGGDFGGGRGGRFGGRGRGSYNDDRGRGEVRGGRGRGFEGRGGGYRGRGGFRGGRGGYRGGGRGRY